MIDLNEKLGELLSLVKGGLSMRSSCRRLKLSQYDVPPIIQRECFWLNAINKRGFTVGASYYDTLYLPKEKPEDPQRLAISTAIIPKRNHSNIFCDDIINYYLPLNNDLYNQSGTTF